MHNSSGMTISEAKKLLDLNGKGKLSPQTIEKAYAEKMKHWSTVMNCALSLEDRERASDAIALLSDAKKVCLASPPKPSPTPAKSYPQPQQIFSTWNSGGSLFPPASPTFPSMRILRFLDRVRIIWIHTQCTVEKALIILAIPFQIIAAFFRAIVNAVESAPQYKWMKVVPIVVVLFGLTYIGTGKGCAHLPISVAQRANASIGENETATTTLYIRSWPPSKVIVGESKTVYAPAREPISIRPGRQSFYFIPEDQSITSLRVEVDLPPGKRVELRADLESRKCTLIDLTNAK